MMDSFTDDFWGGGGWYDYGYSGTYGGDYYNPPDTSGTGSGLISVTVPSKSINLPGIGTISVGGFTWGPGGGTSGNTAGREVASRLSNQFEVAMKSNLAAFQAKTISQSQALSNFDTLWAEYNAALNQAGAAEKTRAIQDRQRGGKFDWFPAYRDPISGTPGVGGGSPILIPGVTGTSGLVSWLQNNLLIVLIIVGVAVWAGARK